VTCGAPAASPSGKEEKIYSLTSAMSGWSPLPTIRNPRPDILANPDAGSSPDTGTVGGATNSRHHTDITADPQFERTAGFTTHHCHHSSALRYLRLHGPYAAAAQDRVEPCARTIQNSTSTSMDGSQWRAYLQVPVSTQVPLYACRHHQAS
jgi:hypothetical protein